MLRSLRSLLVVLVPSMLVACAATPSGEEEDTPAPTAENDLVGIADLEPLQTSLGLTWDAQRTRPEARVKAGPCYARMEQTGRPWNMRRYTTGAAFFFTNVAGDAKNPVECVDLDVPASDRTIGLAGLSLDIAGRSGLGKLVADDNTADPTGGGVRTFTFARGAIEIATVPADFPLTIADNVAAYDVSFRGMIRSVTIAGMPTDRGPLTSGYAAPTVPQLASRATMLAHRYAKTSPGASLDNDPVGRLLGIEDRTGADPDERHYVFHYERVDVNYMLYRTALMGAGLPPEPPIPDDRSEWIALLPHGDSPYSASCRHDLEPAASPIVCAVHSDLGRWEKGWGTD
ncbi:MAG: hypothetical protein KIT84_24285 [Labilithrix sp.]|nr:hypothetical protein [Labilithrix sp.]MCW5814169.1 hypothetical protein [Labilithrix sp.]